MRDSNSTPKQSFQNINAIFFFSLTYSLQLGTSLATTALNNKFKLPASRSYILQSS